MRWHVHGGLAARLVSPEQRDSLRHRNWNQYAYIEDIVADVRFRRRGIGRSLILAAVQWAKEKHMPGVMLETQNNNVAACRLYQACGFEISGFDRLLYRGELPATEEIALYWYLVFGSTDAGERAGNYRGNSVDL